MISYLWKGEKICVVTFHISSHMCWRSFYSHCSHHWDPSSVAPRSLTPRAECVYCGYEDQLCMGEERIYTWHVHLMLHCCVVTKFSHVHCIRMYMHTTYDYCIAIINIVVIAGTPAL